MEGTEDWSEKGKVIGDEEDGRKARRRGGREK